MWKMTPKLGRPYLSSAAIPFLGIGIYLLTSILYIFPSGSPQPADYLLILGMGATMLFAWNRIPNEQTLYFVGGLFLSWVVFVNAFWFLSIGDFTFVRKTSFYLYNMAVFLFVVAAGFHDFERLKQVVRWACILALFTQVLHLEVLPDITKRATGTFNNANQMGYWALLAITCLAISKDRSRLTLVDVCALGAGVYAVLLTLSKASAISAFVLIFLVVAIRRCDRYAGWLVAVSVLVGVLVQVATGDVLQRAFSLDPVMAMSEELVEIKSDGQQDVLKRGYRRLIEYPHYLAFGAGEGAFYRLDTEYFGVKDKEFHSSFGNLLISYGFVGFVLFIVLLGVVLSRATWPGALYMLPIILFGITHVAFRNSMFWVFLGLIYAQGRYGTQEADEDAMATNASPARS